jgi:hypothetical protein
MAFTTDAPIVGIAEAYEAMLRHAETSSHRLPFLRVNFHGRL